MDPDLKKRYWVFGIDQYYPSGGLSDVVFSTDNISTAWEYIKDPGKFRGYRSDSMFIFDSEKREYVEPEEGVCGC